MWLMCTRYVYTHVSVCTSCCLHTFQTQPSTTVRLSTQGGFSATVPAASNSHSSLLPPVGWFNLITYKLWFSHGDQKWMGAVSDSGWNGGIAHALKHWFLTRMLHPLDAGHCVWLWGIADWRREPQTDAPTRPSRCWWRSPRFGVRMASWRDAWGWVSDHWWIRTEATGCSWKHWSPWSVGH